MRLRLESFIDECQLNDVTLIAFASFLGVGMTGDVVMKDESSYRKQSFKQTLNMVNILIASEGLASK